MFGEKLRQAATGIWCLESYFLALGCKGSLRMSVIETQRGLVIYSPVSLTPDHVRQIDSIGHVSTIIAPNLYHHMFLRDCATIYNKARVLVPQGLISKIGTVARAEVIDDNTVLGPPNEIEHFTFSGHGLRETILYHVPSRTLITGDLLYNYTPDQFFAEKLWFRLIGCYGKPDVAFYHRFSIKDRASAANLIRRVNSWQVSQVIMSHGRILTDERAGDVFTTAWERIARLN